MERLGLEIDPVPAWRPADYVPLNKLPKWLDPEYAKAARRLEAVIVQREKEAAERGETTARAAAKPQEEYCHVLECSQSSPCLFHGTREEKKEPAALTEMRARKDPCPAAIYVGNLHDKTGDDHRWTFFISRKKGDSSKEACDLSDFVDRVVIDLHPTFDPPQVVLSGSSPIRLTRVGWGTFVVHATVIFKTDCATRPPLPITHTLQFEKDVECSEVMCPAPRAPPFPLKVELKKTTTRVTTVTGKIYTEKK